VKLDTCVTYEGFGRRLLAGLMDLALALVVVLALVLLRLASEESPPRASAVVEALSGLRISAPWIFAMIFSAQTLFWTFLAGTPGMLLMGCLVLRAGSGRPLPLYRSLVRCVGLWLGLACLGAGVLWSIWDPRHQGLHDKLAGSVVVKEDESLMTLDELSSGVK
jgi:uncharacterized RDD family membrane protein YckC